MFNFIYISTGYDFLMRKVFLAGGELYKNSAGWLVIISGTVTSGAVTSRGIIASTLCWFL
ncbi:hypothetical protein [Pseudoalteromonas sp. DSM 26666]|uniref:hypothetical protein n=1 Tax=Pseudoalteromonas sp. DSM 26666 TaxID=1761892 RepID=UPI000B88BE0F|nr:hypothetical protein [Pseudoalteromonas sp. DSM 26666]